MANVPSKDKVEGGEFPDWSESTPFTLSSFAAHDASESDSFSEQVKEKESDHYACEGTTVKEVKSPLQKNGSKTVEELRSLHAHSLMQFSCHFESDCEDKRPDGFLEEEFEDEFPSLTLRKHLLKKDGIEETTPGESLMDDGYLRALNDYHFGAP